MSDTRHEKFIQLLKLGQMHEVEASKILCRYLRKKYNEEFNIISRCDNFRYDFMLSNNFTYEVKADIKAGITGKLYVEFMQNSKLSGISTTEANFYIFVIPTKDNKFTYILIDTDELRKLILHKKYMFIHQDIFKSGYVFEKKLILRYGISIG